MFSCIREVAQRAKKVVSDSPGLVDFAIGLVIFVLNLPDEQVLFWGEIQITEGLINPANPVTCGQVHASYSVPEWQAGNGNIGRFLSQAPSLFF